MSAHPVEWVLVVCYNRSAHRATYGRINNTTYTKDYIQLSRKEEFIETVSRVFPVAEGMESVPLIFQWPGETTSGAFVYQSADRPHLKWETRLGAPKVWKMSVSPSATSAETIPGNPSHTDSAAAENEFDRIGNRGAGQPYLLAIKLRNESNKLHLRVYLENPRKTFAWADLRLVPEPIQALVGKTSPRLATYCDTFESGGVLPSPNIEELVSKISEFETPVSIVNELDADTGRSLASYLRDPGYGLFFDPDRNHDAWLQPMPIPKTVTECSQEILSVLDARFSSILQSDAANTNVRTSPSAANFLSIAQDDAAAEGMEVDHDEVQSFRNQIERRSFEVLDSTSTVKTRGSAQRAFADKVKSNYRMRCAITGIKTRGFLVAAHIVPWSNDQSIRLDPANGICLSLLVDRAFEIGYLIIEDDYSVRIDFDRIGSDASLRSQLEPYDGMRLNVPAEGAPRIEFLQRRRVLSDEFWA